MGKALFQTGLLILLGQFVFAHSLVLATSEDLSEFDRQISEAQKSPTNNLGIKVSEESKRKKMGQWVQDQKNNEDKKIPTSSESRGKGNFSAASSAKDARVSAPSNNDRGNSSNAPGRNK